MDYAEMIKWIITIGIGAVITIVGSLVGLYLLIRNIPNEIKKQKLAVKKEELSTDKEDVSLAQQMQNYALQTAANALDLQKKLTSIENAYKEVVKQQDIFKETIQKQAEKILEQEKTIKIQSEQIRIMSEKATLQDEKIASLTIELSLYKKNNEDCK